MKKLVLFHFLLFLFQHNFLVASKPEFSNAVYLNRNSFNEGDKVDLLNFTWHYRLDTTNFNSVFVENLSLNADSIAKGKDLSHHLNYLSEKKIAVFQIRILIDSSLKNKSVLFDIIQFGITKIFYDNELVISLGSYDENTKKFAFEKSANYGFPVNFGGLGWHTLTIKYTNPFIHLFNKQIENFNFEKFQLHYNCNRELVNLINSKTSIHKNIDTFAYLGFAIVVFFISIMLYFVINKNKIYGWFSLYLFLLVPEYLFPVLFNYLLNPNAIINFKFYAYSIGQPLGFISFFGFLFAIEYANTPRRFIYYCLLCLLLSISVLVSFLVSSFYVEGMLISNFLNKLLFAISFVEILILLYHILKKKRLEHIVLFIGILIYSLKIIYNSVYYLIFHADTNTPYLDSISRFALPLFMLIAILIYTKNIFDENLAKQAKVLSLTRANEKILEEQNLTLEVQVKERTAELVYQKQVIEEKRKEITDSIEYALRIQTAILPPLKTVKSYLENSFILYKPKDIVAGDFYWIERVNDLILFAVCDCTGHGVPGAMVSVVCYNALNRAVREFGLIEPAAILDKTAEIVIENFNKSEEEIKDGMDISLCSYHVKTKTLQWSGANHPLWLIQNGQLIETKADKQPIGKNEYSKAFTNHTFILTEGDTIYLFTDGYADQFGGELGEKKLTKRRFKELILSIQNKSIHEQGNVLEKFIVEYRNSIEQIDDILVMGVKI